MVGHEALGVEGHIALEAHVHCLVVLLPHLQAHLAVPGHLLPIPDLGVNHPVGHTVVPTNNTFNIYISTLL